MTPLEAFQQAKETGQIQITKQTADILASIAAFRKAADDMTDSIIDNLPEEISYADTVDKFTDDFYGHFSPLMDYLSSWLGTMLYEKVFLLGTVDKFEGV